MQEEAIGYLTYHKGQVQNLRGQLGHGDGVVVAIGDV